MVLCGHKGTVGDTAIFLFPFTELLVEQMMFI
jgi:hypothetical protein